MINKKQNEFFNNIGDSKGVFFEATYSFSKDNYKEKSEEVLLIKFLKLKGISQSDHMHDVYSDLLKRKLVSFVTYCTDRNGIDMISIYPEPSPEFLQEHFEFERQSKQEEFNESIIKANKDMLDANINMLEVNENIHKTNKYIKIGTIGTMIIGAISLVAYIIIEIVKFKTS